MNARLDSIMFDIQLIVRYRQVNIDSEKVYDTNRDKLYDILCDTRLAKMECLSATFHSGTPPPTFSHCSAPLCYSSSSTVQDITVVQLGCWPEKAVPECFTELHRYTCLCATSLCNDKPPSSSIATPEMAPWHILLIVLVALFVLSVIIVKVKNRCNVKNDKVRDLRENNVLSVTSHYQNIVSTKNSREVVLYEGDPRDCLERVVVDEQKSEDLASDDSTYSEIENIDYNYNQVEELGIDYNYNQVEELGSQASLGYQETVFLDTTKFAVSHRHMDNTNLVVNDSCHEVRFKDTGKLDDDEHNEGNGSFVSLGYQEVRYVDTRKLSVFKDTKLDLCQSEENLRMSSPDNANNHPDHKVYGFIAGHCQNEGCSMSESSEYLQNVSGTIV